MHMQRFTVRYAVAQSVGIGSMLLMSRRVERSMAIVFFTLRESRKVCSDFQHLLLREYLERIPTLNDGFSHSATQHNTSSEEELSI